MFPESELSPVEKRQIVCRQLATEMLGEKDTQIVDEYLAAWSHWALRISENAEVIKRAEESVPKFRDVQRKEDVWFRGFMAAGFDSPELRDTLLV